MKRATVGTWANYATTVAFQVVFASRYGTNRSASAFVIVFSLAVSVSGLLVSTVQTIAVPRLLAPDGALASQTVRFLGVIGSLAGALAIVVGLSAGVTAAFVGMLVDLDPATMTEIIRWGAAVLFLQFLSGALGAVSLAFGQRLLPSLMPAIPSTLAAGILLVVPDLSVAAILGWFSVGLAIQTIVLGAALMTHVKFARIVSPPVTSAALLILGSYILTAMILPLERILAATHSSGDAASYDYAIRSLRAVELLLLGGLVFASLGDWSGLAAGSRHGDLPKELLRALVLGVQSLVLAASIAIVAGHSLVTLLYERGSFSAADSDQVTTAMLLGLPGFVGEGTGLIVAPGLATTKHTSELAAVGTANFALRLVLLLLLAPWLGAAGVAIGYSLTQVILGATLVGVAVKRGLLPARSSQIAVSSGFVALGTIVTALVLFLLASSNPAAINGAIVAAAWASLFLIIRPIPLGKLIRQ